MSEVKRYDISAFGSMSMDECGDGAYVNYEDYAELEAKCAALAAENATLNDKMNRILVWPGIEFYSSAWEFCNLDGNDAIELMCDNKTPATDAFLAEVRAQGVEMAMEHMQSSGSLTFGDCYISLNEFAAQLRKGVDKK
ncbi:Eae protein [Escherichia phage vB_EcoS_swi2]|uniref:Eae protein n=1 Tax=Escherichia phage vB_EcoS_swi2 TaxID=2769808 RepID=A0A862QT64_9CAUD|nr:Eae protein [Escherichia phage vB_EcoS_swi2]QNR52497.1 Eae protein [Escherichia phage vB_EcoS_swi2]